MRRAILLAIVTLSACSSPANVAEEYESEPKVYTVIDPDDPHVVLEDGARMGVDGAQAGDQVDIGSLTLRRKQKPAE